MTAQPGAHGHGAPGPASDHPERKKGPMETIIDGAATALGNTVAFLATSGILFLIFAALWLVVGVGIVLSQGSVDAVWEQIRQLPLLVQAVAWLLLLPVMAGLWIWESSWPLMIRAVLVLGIAGWTLLVMLPRASNQS
jgi:ABC-type amino acid transport system permease subunit